MFPNRREGLIRALAMVKEAAARANGDLGLLDGPTARAIVDACREIEQGRLHEHLSGFSGVGGTGSGLLESGLIGLMKPQVIQLQPKNIVFLFQGVVRRLRYLLQLLIIEKRVY